MIEWKEEDTQKQNNEIQEYQLANDTQWLQTIIPLFSLMGLSL